MLSARRRTDSTSEHGFSLVELLVAMVVTLIVTGAIYGLLASGQNAFRREPLLSERQQNVRSAMDILQADIATAGSGLPYQVQIFAGPPNYANAGLQAGPDVLQMYTNDGNCPVIPAGNQVLGGETASHAVSGRVFTASRPLPTCYGAAGSRGYFAVTSPSTVYVGRGTLGTGAPAPTTITFDAFDATKLEQCAQTPNPASPPNCATVPTVTQDTVSGAFPQNSILPIKIIRYQIAAADPTATPPDNMPCLWRSETGGIDLATNAFTAPGPGNPNVWRLVSRGIINMDVSYLQANTALPAASPTPNNPPVMGSPWPPAYTTMTRSVVVTLTGRTEMQLQAGRPVSPYQGSLTSVTTPRSALVNLNTAAAGGLWWH